MNYLAAIFAPLVAVIITVAFVVWLNNYYLRHYPTADDLYGCTVAQQAPNGECK